jgi:hypothetical protein
LSRRVSVSGAFVMPYRALADLTVVVHLAFILFVVFGGLLVVRRPWLAWLHLPAALWGALIEFAGWICPLTPLENWLRQQAGETAYANSFVEQYLLPVLYPTSLTRDIQIALGALVLVVNAIPYAILVRRRRPKRGR